MFAAVCKRYHLDPRYMLKATRVMRISANLRRLIMMSLAKCCSGKVCQQINRAHIFCFGLTRTIVEYHIRNAYCRASIGLYSKDGASTTRAREVVLQYV